MAKPRKKTLILAVSVATAITAAALVTAFSPYEYDKSFGYSLVQHSVVIKAPAEALYRYLGNSANASEWSGFVDHITPLNPDQVADGRVGSFRRCFKSADENGLQWDEEIVVDEPNRRRRLTVFNMKDFPMDADWLATEQIYSDDPNGTRLTFTLFFREKPSLTDAIKMHFAAYRVKSIYRGNMENIRNIIENQTVAGN